MPEKFDTMDELIISFLRGSITSRDKKLLEEWINADKAQKEYFKTFYRIWNTLEAVDKSALNEERILEKIRYRIADKPGSAANLPTRWNLFTTFSKWAAVFIVAFGMGALLVMYVDKGSEIAVKSDKFNGITIPLGSKSFIDLPDGTTVILNAGSKLTYNTDYGVETREVELIGEGYFKVARDKRRPFIVHTEKADIRALGTEFNVKAYPDEDIIETILVSGTVVVDEINNEKGLENKQVVLKPGQKITLYKALAKEDVGPVINQGKRMKPEQIVPLMPKLLEADPVIETSWKDEQWIIKGQNMEELSVLLSRRFNIEITILDKDLAKYKFSGTIRNETVEQVFEIIRLTIPLSFAIDQGRATWSINRGLEKDYEKAYKHDK